MDSSSSMARSLVALLVVTGAFASAVACGSSSDTSAPEADAGDAPDVGDIEPTPETGTDSAPPDDGATQATVVAKASDGKPAPGVHVVVSHSDGSLALHTKTGADGTVTVRVPTGGAVSTFSTSTYVSSNTPVSLTRLVWTITSPPNGAVLERGAAATTSTVASLPPNDPMTLKFGVLAAGDVPPGATRLELSPLCGGGLTTGLTLPAQWSYEGCRGKSTYDLILYAQNSKRENLGYALLLDQPFTPGGTVTHSLKPTRTSFVTTQTTLASIPAGSTRADIKMVGTQTGRVYATDTRFVWSPPAASETAVLSLPVEFASTLVVEESFSTEGDARHFTHTRRYVAPGTPPASTIVTHDRVANIRTIAPLDMSVISRPSASWSLEPTGTRNGCVRGQALWQRGPSETGQWFLDQVAAEIGEAKFPELPPELAEFAAKVGDTIRGPSISHLDVTGKTGLDACSVGPTDESTYWNAIYK